MENTSVILGLPLGIIAGIFLGSFALPMKKMTKWNWENIWILYTVWATIVIPIILALITVPQLFQIYTSSSLTTLFTVFIFGAIWGIANIGFGLGVKMLGLALATAIILGMNNAIGSILPILICYPDQIMEPTGLAISGGVMFMIAGIMICSIAGAKKDKALKTSRITGSTSYAKGLVIACIAGFCGAMFNFALIAGKPLEKISLTHGATALNAVNATWCISLFGGFSVTLLYCIYLFRQNGSTGLFFAEGTKSYWLYACIMGLVWFTGVALYGMAVTQLGSLGPSIGWPIIQSMAVASGNFWGILTGEWKGSGRQPFLIMISGLVMLFIGIAFVGWSTTL
jgi:L-rhamnose-H+ transport protein